MGAFGCCLRMPAVARISLRPGETPEQAQERRLRESQKVEERVIPICDEVDWDRETAGSGNNLVVVEVCLQHIPRRSDTLLWLSLLRQMHALKA